MLKRVSLFRALAVVLLVTAFSSQALAAWGKNNNSGKVDRQAIAAAIAKKLNLTQDQIAQFKADEQDRQKTIEADRQKIKELGDKLKEELAKDSPDKNTVHDLITRIGAQTADMRIARTDSLLKLRETLTPEQKEKFKEMLNKKGGKIHPWLGGNRH
jgi:Spy/CpxP family protein refolding chaperone